ncbi:hypothetical protein C8R47DRAFT_1214271 [Mycena vitilis]|nr:hypothetical protein C8R47DRAFT_1214271 [Mycena vitilis]
MDLSHSSVPQQHQRMQQPSGSDPLEENAGTAPAGAAPTGFDVAQASPPAALALARAVVQSVLAEFHDFGVDVQERLAHPLLHLSFRNLGRLGRELEASGVPADYFLAFRKEWLRFHGMIPHRPHPWEMWPRHARSALLFSSLGCGSRHACEGVIARLVMALSAAMSMDWLSEDPQPRLQVVDVPLVLEDPVVRTAGVYARGWIGRSGRGAPSFSRMPPSAMKQ